MSDPALDDWPSMCEHWRALTLKYYGPLSDSKCNEIVQDSLEAIKTHKQPEDTKESGAHGWSGWHRLDDDEHYVRFMTRKTMHATVEQLVDLSWSILSDGGVYKKYHLGDKCDFFHQIVQRISPDMMVIQMVEKYPNLAQMTHSLALVFRVPTDTGYLVVFRSIESPQLLSLMKAEGLSLGGSFFWETYVVSHRDERGECDAVQYTLAGSIGSDDSTYAKRWCDEILVAMVRSESVRLDTPMLPIEPFTKVDSVSTNDNQETHVTP